MLIHHLLKIYPAFLPVLLLAACSKAPTDVEWRHYNGDWGGTKYSELDQINTSNIQGLELVWRYRVPDFVEGKNTAIQTNPLMANGILYVITVGQKMVAMKPDTGEELWVFDPYDGSGATGKTRAMLYWEPSQFPQG